MVEWKFIKHKSFRHVSWTRWCSHDLLSSLRREKWVCGSKRKENICVVKKACRLHLTPSYLQCLFSSRPTAEVAHAKTSTIGSRSHLIHVAHEEVERDHDGTHKVNNLIVTNDVMTSKHCGGRRHVESYQSTAEQAFGCLQDGGDKF